MGLFDFGGGLDFGQGMASIPPPPPPPPPTIGPQGGQGSGIGSGLGLGGLGQGGSIGGGQQGQGGQGGMSKAPPLPEAAPISPPGNSGSITGGGSASLSAMTPGQEAQGQQPKQPQAPAGTQQGQQQRAVAKYQDVVKQLETSGGATKSQHLGGAANQFQFDQNARARFQPPGSDWDHPDTQVSTLNNETAHNRVLFQSSLGRDPTDSELFLAHNQGFHGANQMLRFPDQSPVQLGLNPNNIMSNVPGGVNASSYVHAPSRNFTSMWEQHYNRTAQQVGSAPGGDANRPVPTSDMRDIAGQASDIGGGAEGAIEGATHGGDGELDKFLHGIKTGEGVPSYSGFSPTGAIGPYGLTGGFIKDWGARAGMPTDRQSYIGNQAQQDALAKYAAANMHSQYGDWKSVANAWLTGSPTATVSQPGNMSPAAYDAKVLGSAGLGGIDSLGSTGGATPQGTAHRANTFGGAAPEGSPVAGPHVKGLAEKNAALAGPEQAYKDALNQPPPAPTPMPDIKGYVEQWRQQHNQSLINGQAPAFKGIWMGIMRLGAGMLNGAFGHSSQAVGGFGNYSEGLYRGNKKQAQEGLADLKEGVDLMIKQYDLADRHRDEILQNRTTDINTKLELLKLEAAKNGDKEMAAALDKKDLEAADKIQFDRQTKISELQQHMKKADEISSKWAYDEGFKEKQAQQKQVDGAQKEADNSMKELMAASAKKAEAIMKGGAENALKLLDKNIEMAAKRRNEALAKLQTLQAAQSGQAPQEEAGPEPAATEGGQAAQFQRTPFNHELGDMVKQKDGSMWLYKGTGDRADKSSYEQVE